MVLLSLLVHVSLAATPVLHAGSGAEALSAVGQITGAADKDLAPVEISTLLRGPTTVIGGAQPPPCAGPRVDPLALWDVVNNKVEPKVVRQDYEEAAALLDGAIAALPCLNVTVERSLGAQLHFLRGLSAFALGDAKLAGAHFERVLDYDRGFVYPSRHSDEAKALFAQVSAAPRPSGALLLAPDVAARGALMVDGNLVTGAPQLPAGPHLVQLAGSPVTTLLVQLRADGPVAIVGDGAALLAAVDRPEGVAALNLLLARDLAGADPVYLSSAGAVWSGPGDWRRLGTISAANAARAQSAARLRAVGLTTATLGAGMALTGLGVSMVRRDDTEDADPDAYYEALGAAKANRLWTLASAGVAVAGVGLFSAGLVISPTSASLGWQF